MVGHPTLAHMILSKAEEQIRTGKDREVMVNANLGEKRQIMQKKTKFNVISSLFAAIQQEDMDDVSRVSTNLTTLVKNSRLSARAFNALGLLSGDYLSLFLPNTTEYHPLVLGAWMCGATACPSNPNLTRETMKLQLEDVKPKVVVCTLENESRVKSALSEVVGDTAKLLILSLKEKSEVSGNLRLTELLKKAEQYDDPPMSQQHTEFDPKAVPILFWSSGTTGKPKGILLPNDTLMSWMRGWGSNDMPKYIYLQTTCFFHGGGFLGPINCIMGESSTTFFPIEKLEGKDCVSKLYKAVEQLKPTYITGGSHHIMRMCFSPRSASEDFDLSSVATVAPLGASVPENTQEMLKVHFKSLKTVLNGYGQTEFGGIVTLSVTPKFLGSVYPGTEVKIVKPNSGKTCGPNETGEIMLRGVYTMKGYLNRPEETAAYFGKDGFCHTGDLGHYDDDLVLHYDGRLKEIIKYQNIHIHPAEVEKIIIKHPGVEQVGVFGKPHPCDQEHVCAAIVKKEGENVSADEIKNLVKKEAENSKELRGGVFFVDNLPVSPQGKVQRKRLAEMLLES